MKTQIDQTQHLQQAVDQKVQSERGTAGIATLGDNRPSTVFQRKLQQKMNTFTSDRSIPSQKKAKGTTRFQQIASAMGKQYGVDTSGLHATHNSSFPAKLNAEATIQGSKIHFAPGMDTDDNIKHEVAHAIDNALHGTPKGNQVVNGQKIDTTREQVADRMAKVPTVQRKPKNHAPIQGSHNALQLQSIKHHGNKVVQCKTVLLGEIHNMDPLVARGFDNDGDSTWGPFIAEPSKIAAAMLTKNNFTPVNNYYNTLHDGVTKGKIKEIMELAQNINLGHEPQWGAENNLIGIYSALDLFYKKNVNAGFHPKDARTHIEPDLPYNGAIFLSEVSKVNKGNISPANMLKVLRRSMFNPTPTPAPTPLDIFQMLAPKKTTERIVRALEKCKPMRIAWNQVVIKKLKGSNLIKYPADRGNNKEYLTKIFTQAYDIISLTLLELIEPFLIMMKGYLSGSSQTHLENEARAKCTWAKNEIHSMVTGSEGTEATGESLALDAVGNFDDHIQYSPELEALHRISVFARSLLQLQGIENNNRPAVNGNNDQGYVLGDGHLEHLLAYASKIVEGDHFQRFLTDTSLFYVRTKDYQGLVDFMKEYFEKNEWVGYGLDDGSGGTEFKVL